jgi:hypothetical protein
MEPNHDPRTEPLTTYNGVPVFVSQSGEFSATVGPKGRIVRADTLDNVRAGIEAWQQEDAEAKRKDVNIPFRMRSGSRLWDCVYLGIRANGKHAIRVPDEPKPVRAEDYSDWSSEVVPDTVPDSALAEFREAQAALSLATERASKATKALRGSRLPWHGNPSGDMRKPTDRAKEQDRFSRELQDIKNKKLP